MEVLGRIDNPFLPRYFYFTASFTNYALAFPCAVIVLAASLLGAQQRIIYSDFLLKLLGWVGVILIGMSIPDDKKIRYILPMLPAVALIAAYPWLVLTTHTYLNSLRKLMIKLFLLLPSLFFLLTFFVYRYAHQHAFHFNINYIDVAVICIFIQALLILNFYLVPIQWRELGIIGLVTLNFILIYILMIEPMELYIERAHKLVVSVETKRHAYQAKLVFYKEKPDGLPIKYLINMPQPTQPLFVDRFNDLFSITTPAFFVTSQTYFNEQLKDFTAHFDLIAQDSLGHVPIVVFKRKTVA